MAKKQRNKGFSLVEIVIAIAILTILLTPILRQLAATMKMNRTAKRQQKVNENAQYVMEYFQNTRLSELKKVGDSSKEIYATEAVSEEARECQIYVADYNETDKRYTVMALVDEAGDPVKIDYTVKKFKLNPQSVNGTQYDRTVYLDDLSTCMMAEGFMYEGAKHSFRIAYELPARDSVEPSIINTNDFVRTNEGSYVQYDDSGKYITAVVCVPADDIIANPNLMNAGNVHNLDSRGVALITGYTSEYDEQAYAELYARAMERLRENEPHNWELEMGGSADSYVREYGFDNNLLRMTEVTFKKVKDTNGDYYLVSVDVYYDSVGKEKNSAGEFVTMHDVISYNAYSQKFPCTDDSKPPYIYMEYQPMVTSGVMGNHVEYAKNEYILFNNYVKDAKIYLYKPRWDYAHRFMSGSKGDAGYEDSFTDEQYVLTYATPAEKAILAPAELSSADKAAEYAKYKKSDNYLNVYNAIMDRRNTYYTENYKEDLGYSVYTSKVNIHLGMSYDTETGVTDPHQFIQLYTNLDVDLTSPSRQFYTDQSAVVVGASGAPETVADVYATYFKNGAKARSVGNFAIKTDTQAGNLFKKIEDEENLQDRFYTISVYLDPKSGEGNSVVLHGAKGEY